MHSLIMLASHSESECESDANFMQPIADNRLQSLNTTTKCDESEKAILNVVVSVFEVNLQVKGYHGCSVLLIY